MVPAPPRRVESGPESRRCALTRGLLFGAMVLLFLTGCGDRSSTVTVQLYPAVLGADAQGEQAQWDTVRYAGSTRAPAGLYRIAPQPLITEWNFAALRPWTDADGSSGAAVRLNAYGAQRMQEYSADSTRLRQPMGLRIDGRWAEFGPLLTPVKDRMILFGFTPDELKRLQHHLALR